MYLSLLFKYFVGVWQPIKLHLFLWASIMTWHYFWSQLFLWSPTIKEHHFSVTPISYNNLGVPLSWHREKIDEKKKHRQNLTFGAVFKSQVDSFSAFDWTPHFQIFSTILIGLIKLLMKLSMAAQNVFSWSEPLVHNCSGPLLCVITNDQTWLQLCGA